MKVSKDVAILFFMRSYKAGPNEFVTVKEVCLFTGIGEEEVIKYL